MITYCTNIHPGESWDDIFSAVAVHVPAVKRAISPDRPFPVGLRLSGRAAFEIDEAASGMFSEWCRLNDCFIPTINGFPYGRFHDSPVKEKVYLPDWRNRERADYTKRLGDLLSSWLPDGMTGSISTVPVGFRRHVGEGDLPGVRMNLLETAEHLDQLGQKTGKDILLALEPEPGCILESTADVVRFFERMRFPGHLRRRIGICFDCCHHAVGFETPEEALSTLRDAEIRIGKVQISSALKVSSFESGMLDQFCDPWYLHQVIVRTPEGLLVHYDDLPAALRHYQGGGEWRIHYHLPVFLERPGGFSSTRDFAEKILLLLDPGALLEVETYTWHALPSGLRARSVGEDIVEEILWVESVREKNRCS